MAEAVNGNLNPSFSPHHEALSLPLDNEIGGFRGGTTSAAPSQTHIETAEVAQLSFFYGNRHSYYGPLYQAAFRGDWESAKRFIDSDPNALTARFTIFADSVLTVAARTSQWEFVLKLVDLLPPEALVMQNINGWTALHFAAMGGNLRTAKALVEKNSSLPQITNENGLTPLTVSMTEANPCEELVWYLCRVTGDEQFTGPNSAFLIRSLADSGLYDITLYLLQRYPNLAFAELPQNSGQHLLSWLLKTPSNFESRCKLTFWERWIYKVVHVEVKSAPPLSVIADVGSCLGNTEGVAAISPLMQPRSVAPKVLQWLRILLWKAIVGLIPCIIKVAEAKSRHSYAVEIVKHVCMQVSNMNFQQIFEFFRKDEVIFFAVESGTIEFVDVCIQNFPDFLFFGNMGPFDVLFLRNRHGCTLIQTAILYRQERMLEFLMNTLPLLYKFSYGILDRHKNTSMHIAAKLPPSTVISSVPGAALQMQKELQWFKAVEKLSPPHLKLSKNEDNVTPMDIFIDQHKDLFEKGEKWMKDTSTSGMVVSTLIATVVFAAAFTVPGGNISDKGIPIFLGKDSFIVFAVSVSLALFSSITSLLMFLSILTARYTEDDFLFSLPNKIIIGLGSLFLAIATTMAAFGSALYIMLNERWRWVSVPIIVLTVFPVTLFGMLQLPLFIQMVRSTYGGGILGNKKVQEYGKNKLE